MTSSRYDLVLEGGRVVDGATGGQVQADVAVADGRVAAIEPDLDTARDRTVDCRGCWVLPGLVDAHTHVFEAVSRVGAPADEAHLHRGVVAACDAGTAGASTFPAFDRLVVAGNRMRIVGFLNVSVLGLIDFRFGELLNPDTLQHDDAVTVARTHPEVVRGFKIRLSTDVVGQRCLPLLEQALAIAEDARLPLMVHIGETAAPLPDILTLLHPGDVVAHCYTGKEHGILEDGRVLPEVLKARERGVLFDSAHGRSNLSFAVARRALAEGFLPDVVASDTSARNWRGPVFDLVTTMSKLLALGMTMTDLVPRVTDVPARLLGLDAEGYGQLAVGGPAHVTVLREADEAALPDADGELLRAPRLEPVTTLLHGEPVTPGPWRGEEPAT